MDATKSKILCLASPLVVRDSFVVPSTFTQVYEYFSEEIFVQSFCEATIEKKWSFFTTYFKPDVSIQNQAFPVDTNLFNDETKLVISLMSHFLGLDTKKYVTELLMSLLFKIGTSPTEPKPSQSVFLNNDEFLPESVT